MRYATVRNARTRREAEAYLPHNYRIVFEGTPTPTGMSCFVIEGEDDHGWTLDGYVIPRYASGLIWATEHASFADACEAASAAMN
jgi:hypothetical protein